MEENKTMEQEPEIQEEEVKAEDTAEAEATETAETEETKADEEPDKKGFFGKKKENRQCLRFRQSGTEESTGSGHS